MYHRDIGISVRLWRDGWSIGRCTTLQCGDLSNSMSEDHDRYRPHVDLETHVRSLHPTYWNGNMCWLEIFTYDTELFERTIVVRYIYIM